MATKNEHLSRFFNVRPVFDYREHYNASINMFLPVILDRNPNEIVELKWHFSWPEHSTSQLSYFIPFEKIISHWKQPRNIRFTLLKAVRSNRCVVLSNCFVVWRQNQPFCAYVQDQRLFGFGGIWKETSSHTGFALLTQPANDLLVQLDQQEMPFILNQKHVHYWLNPTTSISKITHLMKTIYPSYKMNAYPIGTAVNDLSTNTSTIYNPIGEKLNPEIDYGVKEKLVRQGWGRNKF